MDIKLKDFEGPLDLLLHLVSKYEMDIYDVPIVEVIEQYLAYIATLQAMKLEIAGDYMVMASQLMLIKSKKLLPTMPKEVPVEEDLEQELLSQIEEYKRFKLLSQGLLDQHQERSKFYTKPPEELILEDVILRQDKTVMDLFLTFSKLLANQAEQKKNSQTVVAREDYRIEDMMRRLDTKLSDSKPLLLQAVFEECQSKAEKITLFLACLEMMKRQQIVVRQEKNFENIYLMLYEAKELREVEV
ncbi:segregation/condensation protein A [Streptococcus sp. zg-JUN1979]|uniref:segregation/condensation protein A n=1 Tax=Streptococcus sp. zg-JUN1979 TaxID=3391450 RepID=UPI0039A6CC18